jgi:NAD(P) transhydrogenase subunit alpha
VSTWLGFVAVISASINVIGGFLITDRMLKMFKREIPVKPGDKKGSSK